MDVCESLRDICKCRYVGIVPSFGSRKDNKIHSSRNFLNSNCFWIINIFAQNKCENSNSWRHLRNSPTTPRHKARSLKTEICGWHHKFVTIQHSHESLVVAADLLDENVVLCVDVGFNAAVRSADVHDRTTQQADSILQGALNVQLGNGFTSMAMPGF